MTGELLPCKVDVAWLLLLLGHWWHKTLRLRPGRRMSKQFNVDSMKIFHLLGERGARAGWGCGSLLGRKTLREEFGRTTFGSRSTMLWKCLEKVKQDLGDCYISPGEPGVEAMGNQVCCSQLLLRHCCRLWYYKFSDCFGQTNSQATWFNMAGLMCPAMLLFWR